MHCLHVKTLQFLVLFLLPLLILYSATELLIDNDPNIIITYRKTFTPHSVTKLNDVLAKVKQNARIVVICDENKSITHFMQMAMAAGMAVDGFVYIFLETGGLGFGKPPPWIVNDSRPDQRLHEAFRHSLVLDIEIPERSTDFEAEILKRMSDEPFKCIEECANYTSASSQAPMLADAMYLYGKALNTTLRLNPSNGTRDGASIIEAMNMDFMGVFREVVIEKGTRFPIYSLLGLNNMGEQTTYVKLTTREFEVKWEPLYTDESSTIWSVHGDSRPLSHPKCGFDGSQCSEPFLKRYLIFLIAGSLITIVTVLIITSAVVLFIRERLSERKRLAELWQVNYYSLTKDTNQTTSEWDKSALSSSSVHSQISRVPMMTENHETFQLHNERVVANKHSVRPKISKAEAAKLRKLRLIDHPNLNRFYGICINGPTFMTLWKNCSRGSLMDAILNRTLVMDFYFILCFIRDLCEGLKAIHESEFGYHGYLRSAVCLITDHWNIVISDHGMNYLESFIPRRENTQLWTAPELLRSGDNLGTKEGDIYSFAIICSEIITQKLAFNYNESEESVEELVYKVRRGGVPPYRPTMDAQAVAKINTPLVQLIHNCWSEYPDVRPKIDSVHIQLSKMPFRGNLMDHVLELIETQAASLQDQVRQRTDALLLEKQKLDVLLYTMMPQQVAEKLKSGQSVEPELFDSVTVFFSDIVRFASFARRSTPLQVISILNQLFTILDQIIAEHQVYKVETVGDGYLCVSGLPVRNGNLHASEIANLAFGFLQAVSEFRVAHLPMERVSLRIGINTGPCTAGVVGLSMPRYCLFGDTVDTASKMESNSKPDHIHITAETNRYLTKIFHNFVTQSRGEIIVKGKGVMETFWLLSK